jgi:hypothetical protein
VLRAACCSIRPRSAIERLARWFGDGAIKIESREVGARLSFACKALESELVDDVLSIRIHARHLQVDRNADSSQQYKHCTKARGKPSANF